MILRSQSPLHVQNCQVYKSIESARDAKESLQNFPLFNKPMRIAFAKTKSDVIAKEDGTFVPRPKNNLKQDPTKRDAQKRKVEPMFEVPAVVFRY